MIDLAYFIITILFLQIGSKTIQELNPDFLNVITSNSSFDQIIFTLIIIYLLYLRLNKLNLINGLFNITIFYSIYILFLNFFPNIQAILLSFLIMLYYKKNNSIIYHNLIITLAALGVGLFFGSLFRPLDVLIFAALFCIYDVYAVYKTKYMIKMFNQFSKNNAFFATAFPKKLLSNKFFIVGSGDLIFPTIITVSFSKYMPEYVITSIIGSITGYLLLYYLIKIQNSKNPVPALPPIIFCIILSFLIKIIFI